MYKYTVKIEGLMCQNCERHANEAVKDKFSVKKVTSSHVDKEMIITSKEDITADELKDVIKEAGYQMVDMKKEKQKSFFGL